MMKKLLQLSLIVCFSLLGLQSGFGQIISQYVDTDSGTTPKGIEIWNNTGSALDFSTNSLVIEKYVNGSNSPTTEATISSGTLNAGEVLVIGGPDLALWMSTNHPTVTFINDSFSFNGDDALEVVYGGTTTDVFGIIGNDPGTSWSGSGVSTRDSNIGLLSTINTGTTTGFTDPSTRFEEVESDPSILTGFGVAPLPAGPDNPTTFSASVISSTQIDLEYDDNADGDDVIIVFDTDNSFSIPTGDPSVVGNSFAGGTVLFNSNGTGTYNHTGLIPNTTYYYKAWSYDGTDYSAGIEVDATTTAPIYNTFPYTDDFETANNDWLATSNNNTEWERGAPSDTDLNSANSGSNAFGTDLDSNYLDNTEATLTSPMFDNSANGSDLQVSFQYWVNSEADWDGLFFEYSLDGGGSWTKLTTGTSNWYNNTTDQWWDGISTTGFTEAVATISGSANDSDIKFRFVFSSDFSTNEEGALIDDFEVREATATDTDTEVFEPATQVASSTQIAADATAEADSFAVLGFVIEDQGTSDSESTEVIRMRFVPGPNNTAGWSDHIQGITLLDGDLNSYSPTTTISDTEIILDFTTPISIADGAANSVEFELGVYLNTSSIVDGSIIQFQIDAASNGFQADVSGSGFADPFFLGDVVGNNHTIDVDATQLSYLTQPTSVVLNDAISPSVEIAYSDANGLIDTDYSGTGFDISLTTTGSFDDSATTTVEAINGVATFSNLIFNATGTSIILTATDDNTFISGTYDSNTFDVTAAPIVPTPGDVFITEIVDADNDFNAEYLELFNITGNTIDLSTSKLIRMSSGGTTEYVFDFGVDETSGVGTDITIPPYGFLIVARGATRADFDTEYGTLDAAVSYNGGNSANFFGTGRRWRLRTGGAPNTDDGTIIDDTGEGVGSSRDIQNIFTGTFTTSGSFADANPGELDYLIYAGGVWVNNQIADATTSSSDVYFYDDFTASSNIAMNDGGIKSSYVLDLSSNTLDINGTFTFQSDATGTAQLDDASGATITGNVNVERFIPAKRAFRLLSSAVSGVSIADSWQLDTHITGDGGATNGFDNSGSNNPSMFTFNNSLSDQTNGQAWEEVQNTATTLEAGTPYRLLVRGSRATVNLFDNESPSSDVTLSATGSLSTGNLTTGSDLPAMAALQEQYSFIGNPYQAVVNINDLNFTGDVNPDYIYVWDAKIGGENGRGGFVIVDTSTGDPVVDPTAPNPGSSVANEYIMPGQAFFIRNNETVTTSPSITFTEAAKATSIPQTEVFSTNTAPYLNLRLYSQAAWDNNDFESDALGIRWSPNYTTPVSDEDSGKLGNSGENFAVLNENTLVGIDKRNLPDTEEVIPLFINNLDQENYVIYNQFANLSADGKLYLEDHYLETSTLLNSDEVYNFSVDPSIEASFSSDRFSIRFDPETLSNEDFTADRFSIYPNPVQDQFNIAISTELANEAVQVEVFDVMGRSMLKKQVLFSDQKAQPIEAASLPSGVYLVQINAEGKTFTQRIIKM